MFNTVTKAQYQTIERAVRKSNRGDKTAIKAAYNELCVYPAPMLSTVFYCVVESIKLSLQSEFSTLSNNGAYSAMVNYNHGTKMDMTREFYRGKWSPWYGYKQSGLLKVGA